MHAKKAQCKKFQGVLSGNSKDKMANLKITGIFSEEYILNPTVWIFSGIAQETQNQSTPIASYPHLSKVFGKLKSKQTL